MEERVKPGDPDAMFIQDCLMVSFEDRKTLESEDRAIIRKTGLKFRGAKKWPMFRRYEPGYVPWSPDRDGVRYLTEALRQAKEVCLRLRESPALLDSREENSYLIRVSGQSGEWEDV